jgi:hypothetical protein
MVQQVRWWEEASGDSREMVRGDEPWVVILAQVPDLWPFKRQTPTTFR